MKKIGLKVVLTVVALLVVYLVLNQVQNQTTEEGTITIVVVGSNQEQVVRKDIEIEKGATFEQLLREHFEVRIENGMLMEIQGVSANNKDYFLKIYINDVAANYGVKQISVQDKDVIKIAYTKVGDF